MSFIKLIMSRFRGKKGPFESHPTKTKVRKTLKSEAAATKTKISGLDGNIISETPYQKTFAPEAVKTKPWNSGDMILDRYEVRGVKQGGMGWVYLCFDHNYKMPVAIKTLKEPKGADVAYQDLVEKFLLESEAWVRLEKHKNIVQAKGVERIDGQPYIFLEFITADSKNGADLREWIIKRGRLNLQECLNFGIQFCFGMEHAAKTFHQLGKPFVHRDIKPDNIMITHDGVLKITDFGLVKIFDQTQEDIFAGAGTPGYMPPEQWGGSQETDIRSDIYAFGCVLYEMLSGRTPFQCDNYYQYQYQHQEVVPDSINSLVSGIPEQLNGLIMQCLEKMPEKRFKNFRAIREKLNELYQDVTGEKIVVETGEEMEAWEKINKGVALCKLGYRKEAILDYNHAMEIDPKAAGRFFPDTLASIHDWHCPSKRENKLIIHILSHYTNYSNQKSIVDILEILTSIYGLKLISVEGGVGKIDLSFYKDLPDAEQKKQTADYLLKEARIQGHEYFAITTTEDIAFYGADDEELYDQNLKAFEGGLPERERWIAACDHLKKALMMLKDHVNNDELNIFEETISNLEGQTDHEFYIGFFLESFSLNSSFPELSKMIEVFALSKRINVHQANKDKDSLFSYLRDNLNDSRKEGFEKAVYDFSKKKISEYQFYCYIKELLTKNVSTDFIKQYPDLDLYIQQVIQRGELDLIKASEERDAATEAIRNIYYTSEDQKILNTYLNHIKILKKAYSSRLSPSDKEYFNEHKDEIKGSKIASFIIEQSRKFNIPVTREESEFKKEMGNAIFLPEDTTTVGEQLTDSEGFYSAAELRSIALVKNCLDQMDQEKESAGVLVTGGYHSKLIAEYLKENKIPHMVLLPVSELSPDDEQRYKDAVMGKKTPLEEQLKRNGSN